MFDSQKIDSYFETDTPRSEKITAQGFDWRRFFKITLPCIAAALLGVMVVIPNVKKNVDLTDNITVPRKNEMEQLHMEQTVFNITDSKNRVNKIVADNVDETETGSQRYKINNPKGEIPTDNGKMDITSQIGWFNQATNLLEMEKNVKAIVDDNTVITTEAATYDFDNEKGWSEVAVAAEGDWGNMQAEAFSYERANELLVLKGKHKIETERGILTAQKETQVYRNENKSVSIGNAVITQGDKTLYADKIVAYFSDNSKKELQRAEAYGNVQIVTPKEVISGGEGYYSATDGVIEMYAETKDTRQPKRFVNIKQQDNTLQARQVKVYLSKDGKNEIENAEAFNEVKIITPEEVITGGEVYYSPKSGKTDAFGTAKNAKWQKGAVEIIQGENALHAKHITVFTDRNNKIKFAEAFNEVEVITPKGVAWGDKGIYNPKQKKVELFNNVRLEQDGNFILGAHAETDLETSVSRITGDETTGGRISGTFYKKKEAKNGNDAKK